jgi:hypothetical protein
MRWSALIVSVVVLLSGSDATADDTSKAAVVANREALTVCVRQNLKTFRALGSLTPSGVAYFVGLTCSVKREDYRHALELDGTQDVPDLMRQIDTRILAFILDSIEKGN